MQAPLVTVITPLYNYADYIGGCIESILAQTHPAIEMIIVDDGSTDHSAEVVRAYTEKYPNVHYLYQEKQKLGKWNMGVAPALNKALEAARGEYIAWLSADDRACPDRVSKALAVFEADPDPRLAMVYSNAYLEVHERALLDRVPLPDADKEAQFREQGFVRWVSENRDYGEELLLELLKANLINGSTVLIKKRVFDEIGHFDLDYPLVHDYEMWLRMLLKGCVFRYIPEPLLISRVHSVNVPRWNDCQQEGYDLTTKIRASHHLESLYPPLQTRPSRQLYAQVHERLGDIFMSRRQFELAHKDYKAARAYRSSSGLSSKMLRLRALQAVYPLYQQFRRKLS